MYQKRDYLPDLVQLLRSSAPMLTTNELRGLVLEAMPDSHWYGTMLRYLEKFPDALSVGRSDMRPGFIRLADLLIARGVANISRPLCALCKKAKSLPYRHSNGRVCGGCFSQRVNVETCSSCGKQRGIGTRTADGSPVCNVCLHQSKMEPCSICGTVSPVAVRPKGRPVCQLCYDRPPRTCAICRELRPVHSKKDGIDICRDCYMNGNRPTSREKVRHRETRRRTCTSCGQQRSCIDYQTNPLCVPCAGRPLRRCANCGEERPVQAYLEIGPSCSPCYDRERVLVSDSSRRGLVRPAMCTTCGEIVNLYSGGVCVTCVMKARVRELLSDSHGNIPEHLTPLYEVLVRNRDPRSVVGWLRKNDGAALVRRIALAQQTISHDTLDRQERSLAVEFVRSLLIAAGLLPPITVQRRLDVWLDAFMLDVPKEDAFYVRTFAQWRILRRSRPKADRHKLTESGVKWAQMRIRTAAQFLAWLRQKNAALPDCTQSLVDEWLTESDVITPYTIRDFIKWTNSRRFTNKLDVPARQRKGASTQVDEGERWANIERLLAERTISNDIRLAALLSLAFAQHLSRVCMLTVDLVRIESNATFLRFSKDVVEMPSAISRILLAQVDAARANPKSVRADGKQWLFPGQHFGTHVNDSSLQKRLAAIGINTRSARNAALMSLSAQLEPGIVAASFGLHVGTATIWAAHAGRTFNRHVARRMTRG